VPKIKKYMESYVYRDIMKNPINPFNDIKYDLFDELDKIDNKDYTNGYEFYEDLM
jgi:hypothetical protein